jgi:hypothetical protein
VTHKPKKAPTVLLVSENPDVGPMYKWALERAGLSVRVLSELPSGQQEVTAAIIDLTPHDDARDCAFELRRLTRGARLVALTSFATEYPPGWFDAVALLPVLPETLASIVEHIAQAGPRSRTGRTVQPCSA